MVLPDEGRDDVVSFHAAARAAAPRLVCILSENHTLVPPRDLPAVVAIAVEAERAGFDAVMASEHIVLGHGSDAKGRPANPRDYALPGNQDPTTPWPSSLLLLAAVAAVTERVRLVASAVIPPLRHPLLIAKELATLDLLSRGRLVVQPTVSWHRSEYEAMGVPFASRGERLDEHLAAWEVLWRQGPSTFRGRHYRFEDMFLEPKPFRHDGPRMWFGGARLHTRLLGRLVRHGHGFNPLGRPSDEELERLRGAFAAAGRDVGGLEFVGGVRGRFPDETSVASVDEGLATIPEQLARGFTTICVKPSQFTDVPGEIPSLLRRIVDRVAAVRDPSP
ncbi:MAG: TIGR03619 family F420-dependent LLM class oxidoreductase [Actinomycetota bacterium]|nr:TIGR03619 family F420-dependent LLM class oxidoreductase [Actinomycetota bacterium]